jgi:hypothetical protein
VAVKYFVLTTRITQPNGEHTMKKMLSLAAMFAVLAYASPASAELKLGGDAGVRLRNESYSGTSAVNRDANDLMWQYRVRLNAAADLGSGYYFKAMITNENGAGGWTTVNNNSEAFPLQVSNFYFGHTQQNCRWAVGRLPLNAFNNPIFDLALFPFQPLENPVANVLMDRVFGLNYGTKFLSGDLRATLVILDNGVKNNTGAAGDGKLNDGYAIHLAYTDKIGDVTVEPQFIRAITHGAVGGYTPAYSIYPAYDHVTPWVAGANVTVPAGKLKIGLSGFYTKGKNSTQSNGAYATSVVDYSGYQFRVKGEYGNFMCFYDYNRTTDKTPGNRVAGQKDGKYINNFVWAQYKIPVYSSAAGSVTVQPTLRYLTTKADATLGQTNVNQQRLRSELWATVTF